MPVLLETNNADDRLSREEEIKRAKGQVRSMSAHGAWLSEELGVPQLKPLFSDDPEEYDIEPRHEISMLDRAAMRLEGTALDRVDLQLLAMVEHAKKTILADEIASVSGASLHGKLIMYGNSSEGVAAERMAAMHPEKIQAIAAAGLNGIALLPLEELGGRALNYSVGIADFESIVGKSYDQAAHDEVDLVLLQGAEDSRNRLMMDKEEALRRDAWKGNEELYTTARATYGPRMVEDRFPRCHVAFEKAGVSAQFRVVPDMPHDDSMAIHDVLSFFRQSLAGEDVSGFGQRFRLPFDRTIELGTERPHVGNELEFEISGDYLPPEGLVTYNWQVGDGRSAGGPTAQFSFEESRDYEVTLGLETAHGQTGQLGMSLLADGEAFAAFQYAVTPPGPRHLAAGTKLLIGETASFDVEVTNVGSVPGERSVEFIVDDESLASEVVQLDPGGSTTISFEQKFGETGEVDLRIPPAFRGTYIVGQSTPTETEPVPSTPTETEPVPTTPAKTEPASVGTKSDQDGYGTASPGQPGFGLVSTLAGIGGAVAYKLSRETHSE